MIRREPEELAYDLLFGVRAVQMRCLEPEKLGHALDEWVPARGLPFAEFLQQCGVIDRRQRSRVESDLDDRLTLHGGDASAAFAEVAGPAGQETLASVSDSSVIDTLQDCLSNVELELPQGEKPEGRYDRYSIGELAGAGGIGYVHEARDLDLKRLVAIKCLQDKYKDNPNHQARLLREALITGQLEHPNIIPVYELGLLPETGDPFYAMRLVGEKTLREAIQRHHEGPRRTPAQTRLQFRQLLESFVSVCNATAYAHSRCIIHRDLKPQNVVLGSFGEVFLLDWGIAKQLGGEEVETEAVKLPGGPLQPRTEGAMGTPQYMSPEQARGRSEEVDTQSDVYGLGAILYELLTGRPPHEGLQSSQEVLQQIARTPALSPRARNKQVPRPLDAICTKATARDKADRFTTASDLAANVKYWLADERVPAYRDRPMQRLARVARHSPRLTSVLVFAVVLAILVGQLSRQRDAVIDQEVWRWSKEVQTGIGRLDATVDFLERDALYLAGQGEATELLRLLETGGDVEGAKGHLTEVFVEFLENRPSYFQARLMDAEGMELVHVERKAGEKPRSTMGTMEDQGDRDYFRRAVLLQPGQVYLSRLELNREKGEVEVPWVPVLRACAPLLPGDSCGGVVVINLDFRPLFESLDPESSGRESAEADRARSSRHFFVTDEHGHYLWNPVDQGRRFVFSLDVGEEDSGHYRIQHRYPELAPFYDGTDPEDTVFSESTEDARMVYVRRALLNPGEDARALCLAVAVPEGELVQSAEAKLSLFDEPLVWVLVVGLAVMLVMLLPKVGRG